jgi:hypothetical protein
MSDSHNAIKNGNRFTEVRHVLFLSINWLDPYGMNVTPNSADYLGSLKCDSNIRFDRLFSESEVNGGPYLRLFM